MDSARLVLGLDPHSLNWVEWWMEKANNSGERNGPGWEQHDRRQGCDAPFVPAAFQKPLGHRVEARSPCLRVPMAGWGPQSLHPPEDGRTCGAHLLSHLQGRGERRLGWLQPRGSKANTLPSSHQCGRAISSARAGGWLPPFLLQCAC